MAMKKMSVSAAGEPILVWDAPVRVFHWLLVLSFAGAYLTAESERWHLVHITLGYTMGGLVAFRIVWGLVGSRYARFTDFVKPVAAVRRYVASLLARKPEHHVGHNPAGGLAILGLLVLAIAVTVTGWATDNDAREWMEEAHEAAANVMLGLVALHVAAVIGSSWLHRENLVGAMLHGFKRGGPGEGIRSPRRLVAVLVMAAVAGFWGLQWFGSSTGSGLAIGAGHSVHGEQGKHENRSGDDD
ncbi:cytochrome b/b6 domain-containing protein [Noviherbaspirillum galbum]|uniref:Cytochrome B n=1 Tax=Noviherbaspirillum galbum TaxID=2709383 RepID=A0A6B3SVF6_9BURK|nr:cytochrome b/b6 domain-containing protein [Noviherbaspirillum galbum]NEX62362.1 cytochrome B [Noviherbaspirillum galbum]